MFSPTRTALETSMKRILPFLLVLLIGIAAPLFAQDKGRVRLQLPEDRTIALSDTIAVSLCVRGGPKLMVEPPKDLGPAAPWVLVTRSAPQRKALSNGDELWCMTYTFAPRQPGEKIPFAFPDVKYRDGDADETASFPPAQFKVTTQIANPDVSQLKEQPGIEPLPPLETSNQAWIWASVLGGATIGIIAVFIAVRFWLRPSPPRSPAQLGLQEWRRLVAMKLPDNGHGEQFITLLTTLVRRFLERQFALPARRRTTPEFLKSLESSPDLNAAEKSFLASFFADCETVKFANTDATTQECSRWAEQVRQFLNGRNGQASQELMKAKNTQSG